MITDEELRTAIGRLGQTQDGEKLYLWLQRGLMRVVHTPDHGALLHENGRRTLASEIMGMLSRGLSDIYASHRDHDRVVIFSANIGGAGRSVQRGANQRRGVVGEPGFESEYDADGRPK